MDIVVTGRHTTISENFRQHIEAKLSKVDQLAPRTRRIDVIVSHEPNPRRAKACERVEITCHVTGPIVRAEACHEDQRAALDLALDKLHERLRRKHDRRVRRARQQLDPGSQHRPSTLAQSAPEPDDAVGGASERFAGSPIEVREKVHVSVPMTLDQALQQMELVGHDFYLYHDVETDRPSVVYRRRGWSYGVLHLELDPVGEQSRELVSAAVAP